MNGNSKIPGFVLAFFGVVVIKQAFSDTIVLRIIAERHANYIQAIIAAAFVGVTCWTGRYTW